MLDVLDLESTDTEEFVSCSDLGLASRIFVCSTSGGVVDALDSAILEDVELPFFVELLILRGAKKGALSVALL